jgi:hypothetical protein
MPRPHPHREPDRLTLPMDLPNPGFPPSPPFPASAVRPHYGATSRPACDYPPHTSIPPQTRAGICQYTVIRSNPRVIGSHGPPRSHSSRSNQRGRSHALTSPLNRSGSGIPLELGKGTDLGCETYGTVGPARGSKRNEPHGQTEGVLEVDWALSMMDRSSKDAPMLCGRLRLTDRPGQFDGRDHSIAGCVLQLKGAMRRRRGENDEHGSRPSIHRCRGNVLPIAMAVEGAGGVSRREPSCDSVGICRGMVSHWTLATGVRRLLKVRAAARPGGQSQSLTFRTNRWFRVPDHMAFAMADS